MRNRNEMFLFCCCFAVGDNVTASIVDCTTVPMTAVEFGDATLPLDYCNVWRVSRQLSRHQHRLTDATGSMNSNMSQTTPWCESVHCEKCFCRCVTLMSSCRLSVSVGCLSTSSTTVHKPHTDLFFMFFLSSNCSFETLSVQLH